MYTKATIKNLSNITRLLLVLVVMAVSAFSTGAVLLAAEGPAINPRVIQTDILRNSILQNRRDGLRLFSTPFNLFDGLGDGPPDAFDKVSPGGRPTLQNNGIFLRVNGNDSQTCLECHSVLSNFTIPAKFAVGGAGGISDSAFPGVIDPDIDDSDNNGFAAIQGRFINPPAIFGAGAVEALAKEMTVELQALKTQAQANPGTPVSLDTKGVNFGTITFDGSTNTFNTSAVLGIREDLVVRPFGRKGCCFSLRDFDRGALQFHHGMQPAEVVGDGVDDDGDGVADEIFVGELSAIHIFQASLEQPIRTRLNRQERNGRDLFNAIGCAGCHIPELHTDSQFLPLAFPEVPEDPSANVYLQLDLSGRSSRFQRQHGPGIGVVVELFADLKMHHMGHATAESTGDPDAAFFTTARLWGVADTAPYLHDGRAVTLTDAVLMHGGEAQAARDNFAALSDADEDDVIGFLRTLRTPINPSKDLRRRRQPHHNR